MQPQQLVRIEDICSILEIPVSAYGLNDCMPKEDAAKALQDFKDFVKKQHRVLVKKYHPDLPSSGESEEAKMKEINATIDLIMKLKIQRVQSKPQRQNVHFHFTGRRGGSTWSNNNTTSDAFNNFRFY